MPLTAGARSQDLSTLPVRVAGPPPAWIEPGLQLTYTTLVGTLPDADLVYEDAVLLFAPRPAGKSVWIYDLGSGVLLHSSDVTKLGGQRNAAGVDTGAGALQVRYTTFQSSRTLALPWAVRATAPPESLERLAYRGRFIVRQPGAVDTIVLFCLRFTAVQRGPGFLVLTPILPGGVTLPGIERRLVSAHQLAGPWMPPSGLGALKAGQMLDSDRLTLVVTRVSSSDERQVVLTQDSPRQRSELTYRRSDGFLQRLVAEERFASVPGMSKVVELDLVDGG